MVLHNTILECEVILWLLVNSVTLHICFKCGTCLIQFSKRCQSNLNLVLLLEGTSNEAISWQAEIRKVAMYFFTKFRTWNIPQLNLKWLLHMEFWMLSLLLPLGLNLCWDTASKLRLLERIGITFQHYYSWADRQTCYVFQLPFELSWIIGP